MSQTTLPKLGYFRTCYDNTAPEQLRDMPEEMRAKYMLYTYASREYPGTRYVRADTFLRAYPTAGLSTEAELIREIAHALADHFVVTVHGPNAFRVNNMSLDVSLQNVGVAPLAA